MVRIRRNCIVWATMLFGLILTWEMHLIWQVNMYDPPVTLPQPRIINLLTDLKEERDRGQKLVGLPFQW